MEIRPFYLDLSDREIEAIGDKLKSILRGGTLILGEYTRQFEAEFAHYVGTRHAVALNSGTSALEILLTARGAAGKRIAVPSNTNFASVAAIIRCGGQPVYMDMTAEHFVPDLEILRHSVEKYGIQGVVWVHIGGVIAPEFATVVEYCRQRNIFLIEDAAHAHGSKMRGVRAGAFADGGAFSFFPTKVMTTMEGGMITTDNDDDARLARSLRNQGKRDGDYGGLHYDLGSSWRISEIAAYIGLVQLSKLDRMIESRAHAAHAMARTLGEAGVGFVDTTHMERASQYKFIVRLPDGKVASKVKDVLKRDGVICGGGVYDVPCHLHPVFNNIPCDRDALAVTERWCPRHVCPPITSGLSDTQLAHMATALRRALS